MAGKLVGRRGTFSENRRREASSGSVTPADWFVSKNGNNTTGTSWANAWTDLDQINWTNVQAGDIIELDGGETACASNYQFVSDANHATNRPGVLGGMLYTGALVPTKSGTSGSPITMRLSREAGRNGTAVIFGGRQTALPYATQSSYSPVGSGRFRGIDLRNITDFVIDGTHRSGIMIYGCGQNTTANYSVAMSTSSARITLRNIEIFDNGIYNQNGGRSGSVTGWVTNYGMIDAAGSNITIDRCLIHDNGGDGIHSQYGAMSNFTLTNTWIYSNREHPSWAGYSAQTGAETNTAQDANHYDAIQMYAGTNNGPAVVDHCVFGPYPTKGAYFGDVGLGNYWTNVTISESLFLYCPQKSIQGDTTSTANWVIDHVTSIQTPTPAPGYTTGAHHMCDVNGTGHRITNSIKVNGGFGVTGAFTGSNSGNYYETGHAAVPGGTAVSLNIVQGLPDNTPTWADCMAVDTTPQNSTVLNSGAGSEIRKAQDLLDRIDVLNGTPVGFPSLYWSAPDTTGYTETTVPSGGGELILDVGTDYRLVAPSVITAPVRVRGGRNVVWVGGQVSVSLSLGLSEAASTGISLENHPSNPVTAGRIMHVEGIRIGGTGLTQGIRYNAPDTIIQIANVHVELVSFKNCDHRDGTNGLSSNHPDLLQGYGAGASAQEVRVDGFTGSTGYQGIFRNQATTTTWPMYLRRVNVKAVQVASTEEDSGSRNYAGHRIITSEDAVVGPWRIDNGSVYAQHHPNSGWTSSGGFRRVRYWNGSSYTEEAPLGTAVFENAVFTTTGTNTVSSDAQGTYLENSSAKFRNFDNTGQGRVYSGVPATGDYVPVSMVGLNYQGPTSPPSGAVTFVAAATGQSATGGTASTLTVTIPSGVVAGDVLLAVMSSNGAADAHTGSPGWTQVYNQNAGISQGSLWSRTAQAGDAGSTITFTFHSSNVRWGTVAIAAYRGGTLNLAKSSSWFEGAGAVASFTVGGVTSPAANSKRVALIATDNDDQSFTLSGFTQRAVLANWDAGVATATAVAVFDQDISGTVSSTTGSWTADTGAVFTVLIEP